MRALHFAALFGSACSTSAYHDLVANTCLGECYPELKDQPQDHPRSLSHGRRCDCSWGPELEALVRAYSHDVEGAAGLASEAGRVRVFAAGDGNITCFRIPAIVQTTGSLLAFAEARRGGCGDGQVEEIVARRSVDGGRTWSSLMTVAGGQNHTVGNPYPISTAEGSVALVYVQHGQGGGGLGHGNGVVFSTDDGLTWSSERNVSRGFGEASGSLPGPGAGVEVPDGRRLLVVSHHGAYVRDYITYSGDGGRQWAVVNQSFPGMDEATMAVWGSEVLLNMRHTQEQQLGRAVSRSLDGGLTWSAVAFDAALLGPVCQASLATIDGKVYFSNPMSNSSRDHLTVRRSDDGGHTWMSALEIQANRSAGYSSLVQGQLPDGRGGILYESSSPGSIDFSSFSLDLAAAARPGAVRLVYA